MSLVLLTHLDGCTVLRNESTTSFLCMEKGETVWIIVQDALCLETVECLLVIQLVSSTCTILVVDALVCA